MIETIKYFFWLRVVLQTRSGGTIIVNALNAAFFVKLQQDFAALICLVPFFVEIIRLVLKMWDSFKCTDNSWNRSYHVEKEFNAVSVNLRVNKKTWCSLQIKSIHYGALVIVIVVHKKRFYLHKQFCNREVNCIFMVIYNC